jgi:sugar phosphate isomerase/epimerase
VGEYAGQTALGASTGCTYNFDLVTEESLWFLHAAGIRAVEIYLQCDEELEEEYLKDLAGSCAGLGLAVTSLHPYVYGFENLLFSRYQRQRRWAFQRFERYLSAARLLGAPVYVSHGPPPHTVTDGEGFTPAYLGTTSELLGIANDHGVRYCLENVSYGLVRTPLDAHRQLMEFGDELGLVIDVKSAWKSGFRPAEFLQPHQDAVSHIQVSFRRAGRYGLGATGDIADPELEEALRLCLLRRPSIPLVLEVETRSAAELTDTITATRRLLTRLSGAKTQH